MFFNGLWFSWKFVSSYLINIKYLTFFFLNWSQSSLAFNLQCHIFVPQEKMVGVWSFPIILRVVEVVVVDVGAVEVEVEVEVMTWSVMNVVSLVILLENVACVSVLEVGVVEGVEALLLDAVGARVMIDMGAGLLFSSLLFSFFSS